MPDWIGWTVIGIALLIGSAMQSAIGFAFSLFVVPLVLATGLPLPMAVALVLTVSTCQRAITVYSLWKAINWKELLPLTVMALLAMPLGIAVMKILSGHSKEFVNQVVSGMILTVIVVQTAWRVRPKEHVRAVWGYLAGFCGGFLSGLANVGGPPVILWIHAHKWPNPKVRVTTLAFLLPLVPLQYALYFWTFGGKLLPMVGIGMLYLPIVFIGTVIGLSLGHRIPVKWLRIVAYILLGITCLQAIAGPLLK